MKDKKEFFLLFIFVLFLSQQVVAQYEADGFSASFSLILSNVLGDYVTEGHTTNNPSEIGLNINLMFFNDNNFGYYIGTYVLLNDQPLFPKRDDMSSGGSFNIGINPGIGYKKEINDYLGFLAGIGAEFRYVYCGPYYKDINESVSQIGIGLGCILESRLKIVSKFSFSGGVRLSSIFFEGMSNKLLVLPYMGFSWN